MQDAEKKSESRHESWHPPRKTGPITLAEGSAVPSLPFHISVGRSQCQVNKVNLKKWSCNLGSRFCAKQINGFCTLTKGLFLATWSANGTSLILSIILPNLKSA